MKKLILLFSLLLFANPAQTDTKISQLPVGTASASGANDSWPYVFSSTDTTKRLLESDLPNLPSFVARYAPLNSPTFTGFISFPSGSSIDSGGDALFTGVLTVGGALSVNYAPTSGYSATIGAGGTGANSTGDLLLNGSSASGHGPQIVFQQNGTSSGSVSTTGPAIGGSGTDMYFFAYSGNNEYFFSGGSQALKLDTSQSATFAQNVTSNGIFIGNGSSLTALSASNLSSGAVPAARLPAFTGDITTSAGAVATTLATVNASPGSTTLSSITTNGKGLVTSNSSASTTGSGSTVVLNNAPTILGTATFTGNNNILIGTPTTTTAASYLEFNNTSGSGVAYVGVEQNGGGQLYGNTDSYALVLGTTGTRNIDFYTNNSKAMVINTSQALSLPNVSSGTAGTGGGSGGGSACFTSGQVLVSNAANCIVSLRKWKTDLKEMSGKDALDTVIKLSDAARYYRYNDTYLGKSKDQPHVKDAQPGFIAEEVEKIDPRYALYNNGGLQGVKYEQLTATESVAIKELAKLVREQKEEIQELKKEVKFLHDHHLSF